MAYKIIVSPIALKNVDNAVEYYIEQAGKKVALAFLDDYQKVYKALQKNPFINFTIVIIDIYHLKSSLTSLFLLWMNPQKQFF